MKALKIMMYAFVLVILTACQNDEKDVQPEKKVEKAAEVVITAPTNEEVIELTKNFVTMIYDESTAIGGSDETPITEAQYDELTKALTPVATEDSLQGMLKDVLLNLCFACDSNPLPTFYNMNIENLTFENGTLKNDTYSIDVSYANEMIDSLVKESMTFQFVDNVWKVHSFSFEYNSLPDDYVTSGEVEVYNPEAETDTEESYEYPPYEGEITKQTFVGNYQPFYYDESEYFGLVDIFADYSTTVFLDYETPEGDIVSAEWSGNLSFQTDTTATLAITQDGRPGIITFTAKGNAIDLDIEIEEVAEGEEASPFSGEIHLTIPTFDRETEEMRSQIK